jgi:structure-specific recognition protein 1
MAEVLAKPNLQQEKGIYQFGNIALGTKGSGILKMNKDGVGWKSKGGQSVTIVRNDITGVQWVRVGNTSQLRIEVRGGSSYKFDGFREQDTETLRTFFRDNYGMELKSMELCTKGMNWGSVEFVGSTMHFNFDGKRVFEIPLAEVAQSSVPNRNELLMEFHHDDTITEDSASLIEMRFHVPNVKKDKDDQKMSVNGTPAHEEVSQAEQMLEQILSKADVVSATGKGILTFEAMPVLTPRGRYDIELFPSFLKLHGKTYDYKIKYSNIVRLFQLPKPDRRHHFFVVSLEPPIRQGHTSYPHVVIQIAEDEMIEADLNISPDEKDERIKKLPPKVQGPLWQVFMNMFKDLTQKKVTIPSKANFTSSTGAQAVKCSLKAYDGYLFPLDRSFFFVHKPTTHVRFEEIDTVEFARVSRDNSTTASRTFDLNLTLKNGQSLQFTSIHRSEYSPLFNFVAKKQLKILDEDGNVITNPQLLPELPHESHHFGEEVKHVDVDVDVPEEDEAHTAEPAVHNELSQENIATTATITNTDANTNAPKSAKENEKQKRWGMRESLKETRIKIQQDLKIQNDESESDDADFAPVENDEEPPEEYNEKYASGSESEPPSESFSHDEKKSQKKKKEKRKERVRKEKKGKETQKGQKGEKIQEEKTRKRQRGKKTQKET